MVAPVAKVPFGTQTGQDGTEWRFCVMFGRDGIYSNKENERIVQCLCVVLNVMELTSTIRCRKKRRIAALQFCLDATSSDRRICKFISINFCKFIIVLLAALSSSSVQRRRRRRPGYDDGAGEEGAAIVGFGWVCWDWVSSWVAGFVVEEDKATGETRVEEREVTVEKWR
ncbi:S2-RNase [Pyrus ussuriensis x Pyrus communis]|uniref:S2-RNase n=1 Tax=Pyrus ussuriensis x Pyrus communis TaxID=2448454 RepID=A0A5N5EUF5_9ROSA|nr:S2-RNase [Pyrus ussuriensis x Pyrus communis]